MFASSGLVVTAIVIVGMSVGVSLLVLWLTRRLFPNHQLAAYNDVSGFVYAVIGVVYAVIIGFVVINVWTQYDEADDNARFEAGAAGTLHRIAEGLPEPASSALQDATVAYVRTVIEDEWPKLRDGERPGAAELAHTDELWAAIYQIDPQTPREQQLYASALDQVTALSAFRRERFAQSEAGVLGILWAVMIAGGILAVLFPCLFGVEKGFMHGLIVAILAATIGLLLLTVYQLDYPLRGNVHVEPDEFELVLEQFGGGQ